MRASVGCPKTDALRLEYGTSTEELPVFRIGGQVQADADPCKNRPGVVENNDERIAGRNFRQKTLLLLRVEKLKLQTC